MKLTPFIAFALPLWTPAVYPTPAAMVGLIEDLTCPSDYYQLTRQGAPSPLPVKIFMELQAGDTLALKPDQPVLRSKEATLSDAQLPVTIKNADTHLLCKAELFKITRQQTQSPPQNNTLQAGDQVSIDPEGPVLSIRLNGQPGKTVKYNELAYQVTTTAVTPTVYDNFFNQLASWFTAQHDELLKVLIGRAGESEKPRLNVLKGDKQQLVAGDRNLFIAWQGGKPPFTVTLKGPGQPHRYLNLSQRHLQTPVKLTPGSYHLTLQDQDRQATTYIFTVVTSQPRSHSSPKLQNLTDDSRRRLAQTLCLAVHENGIWRFEAIQQATQQADHYAPALLLREALLRGEEIGPMDLAEKDCMD